MRSLRLLAVATGALILGSACGGDNGPGPDENDPPSASFTEVCTNLSCVFTDTSTDPDGAADITSRTWTFGDGTPDGTTTPVTHAYLAAGTYTVTLTVRDAAGVASTPPASKTITVSAGTPGNTAPVSSFTLPTGCVADTPCGFASTSTDPDGAEDIASWSWDFGDGTPAGSGENVTHTFEEAGTYPVVLTVTDIGGLTHASTQPLTVTAPAATDCTTTGTLVTCSFTMTQQVTVKLTVVGENCELSGNKLEVTVPRQQTAFFNLCNQPAGAEYTVQEAGGASTVFAAGSPLTLRFTQGTPGAGDPATGDPGIQVTGNYPNWTLNVDDGGAAGTPGEPDFNDVVLSVQATLAP